MFKLLPNMGKDTSWWRILSLLVDLTVFLPHKRIFQFVLFCRFSYIPEVTRFEFAVQKKVYTDIGMIYSTMPMFESTQEWYS